MLVIALSLFSGILTGAYHVICGPDHLAAVAPLAIRERRTPWVTGALWGIGHSCGVWLIAAAAIALRDCLPLVLISNWSERLGGGILIVVGAWALRRAWLDGRAACDADGGCPRSHHHAALGVGAVHGLAGAAHLLGVLPALLLPSRGAAVAYVAGFGVGSILAMTVFTGLLGTLVRATPRAALFRPRALWALSGLAAISIGAGWLLTAPPTAH